MMWKGSFRQQGYYFRQAGVLTIIGGLYLHVTRAFLGDDLLIERVFTPTFDRVLTIPMCYAAVTGLLAWRHIPFRSRLQKIGYGLTLFYIAGSVPMHVYYAYLNDTTEYLRWFPMWFTFVLYAVYLAIIWGLWRLPYRGADRPEPGAARTPRRALH